jgi:hypothetical protein
MCGRNCVGCKEKNCPRGKEAEEIMKKMDQKKEYAQHRGNTRFY